MEDGDDDDVGHCRFCRYNLLYEYVSEIWGYEHAARYIKNYQDISTDTYVYIYRICHDSYTQHTPFVATDQDKFLHHRMSVKSEKNVV